MTMDHIIPISKAEVGFVYNLCDVQPLCRSCNAKVNGNRKHWTKFFSAKLRMSKDE